MTRSLDSTGLKRLHRDWRRRTPRRLALVLDAVQGPFNVGAIVRTAAAMRVEHVWLLAEAPELDSDKVAKTALGTHRYLSWSRAETPEMLAAQVHSAGYTLVAVELADPATPMHELDLTGDTCLALGHEDRGVRPTLLDACDNVGFIPQLGRVGSLNVATAAGIAMYEVRRQHWNA